MSGVVQFRGSTPAHLSDAARGHWTRLRPMLQKAGILEDVDLPGLAILCELLAAADAAPTGSREWLELASEIGKWLIQFLMTPAARAQAGED